MDKEVEKVGMSVEGVEAQGLHVTACQFADRIAGENTPDNVKSIIDKSRVYLNLLLDSEIDKLKKKSMGKSQMAEEII